MIRFPRKAHSLRDFRSQVCAFLGARGWIQEESQSVESAYDDYASRSI